MAVSANSVLISYWLSQWTSAKDQFQSKYPKIFISLVMTYCFLYLCRVIALIIQFLIGGAKLHIEVAKKVIFSQMSFFEQNTIGKILVRFSKDQGSNRFPIISLHPPCYWRSLQWDSCGNFCSYCKPIHSNIIWSFILSNVIPSQIHFQGVIGILEVRLNAKNTYSPFLSFKNLRNHNPQSLL